MATKASAQDKQKLESSLKELNLSKDEVEKFDKAFKDPKFVKLFEDYVSEISTPEAREEQELYLRQIESEGGSESVYGKGVQLLVPEPGCVAKTKEKKTGEKFFINICKSDKVEVATSKKARNKLGQSGLQWDIPSTMGKVKSGKDKKGQNCRNVDFVVHSMTYQMAEKNAPFKKVLVEMAIEKIEEQHEEIKLNKNFSCPKMEYHGINGMERPSVLGIRTGEGGVSQNGVLKPQANTEVDKKLSGVKHDINENYRSPFCFKKKNDVKKTEKKPEEPGFRHPTGEVTPQYKLVESASVDMSRAWKDVALKGPSSYPKHLCLRVSLPEIRSASDAILDVMEKEVKLHVPGKFKLDLPLPYPVEALKGKAVFLKALCKLHITLPTAPPPKTVIDKNCGSRQEFGRCDGVTGEDPSAQAIREGQKDACIANESHHESLEHPPQQLQDDPAPDCTTEAQVSSQTSSCGPDSSPESQSWLPEVLDCETNEPPSSTKDPNVVEGSEPSNVEKLGPVEQAVVLTENQKKWSELHGKSEVIKDSSVDQGSRAVGDVIPTNENIAPEQAPDSTQLRADTECIRRAPEESTSQKKMAMQALPGADISHTHAMIHDTTSPCSKMVRLQPCIKTRGVEEID